MGPGLEQVLTDHWLENVCVQGSQRHLDPGKHPFLAFPEVVPAVGATSRSSLSLHVFIW